jgi:hypothetical protein
MARTSVGRITRRVALPGLLVGLVAGCYQYQPVEAPAPSIGEQVKVELTGAGQDRLQATRAIPFSELSGSVLSSSTQELLLRVELDSRRLGYGTGTVMDTIRVPREDVREVGVRTLSRNRSIFAAGVAVVAVAGIYALFTADLFSENSTQPRSPPEFLKIPLSSILNAVGGGR